MSRENIDNKTPGTALAGALSCAGTDSEIEGMNG